MEKNKYYSCKKHIIRKIGVFLLCVLMVINTLIAPITSYAMDLYGTNEIMAGDISSGPDTDPDQTENQGAESDEASDITTDVISDVGTPTDADEDTVRVIHEDVCEEVASEEAPGEADGGTESELEIDVEDELDSDTNIPDGGTISAGKFTTSAPYWFSWRHNWTNTSYANSSRTVSLSRQFRQLCINNLTDKTQACNEYVMSVLKANGEMDSSEYVTAYGGYFEKWLANNNYYSVYGDYRQMVTGTLGSKSYTDIAKSTIESIQNGDILVWACENSDGTFSTKHISIGTIYTSDLSPYICSTGETITEGEICVFQSNGGSINGGKSILGVESVAYYLSGANSTTSYGSALRIYRKKSMTGSVSVKKDTTSGGKKSGVTFGLYKVSHVGNSYMSNRTNLDTKSLDLSGLSDTSVTGENGMLTKVATFKTDSSGKGVAALTTGIKNAHASAGRGGTWYYISVSDDGYTINGLPIGDYIVIEEPETVKKSCWIKGGTYDGVTLGSDTVNCSWEVTQEQGTTLSVNGVYSKINPTDTTKKSVNKLCDFGFDQGNQYYAAFTVENESSSNNTITVKAVNIDTGKGLKLIKSSANKTVTKNNACYSLKGAVYAVYEEKKSASAASRDDYKKLSGYVGKLTTDEDGNTNTISDLSDITYYVKEVIAPDGYALDTTVYEADMTDSSNISSNIYKLKVTDAPKLNTVDVLLVKKEGLNNKALAGAEFTIKFYAADYSDGVDPATKSAKAARTWVVKTDKNGKAKADDDHKVSGSDWYTDSDKVVFPLGTVTIQETKAPTGYQLDDTVYVYKISSTGTSKTVKAYNAPEITDEPVPNVKTSATDSKSGSRISQASENAVIYDDVSMTKLMVGKTYTIKGVLMDRETGEKLLVDGKTVTAKETFKATASSMTVRMAYEFDSSALTGKETVVFEDLYEGSKKVAVHNDLTDNFQTVSIDETLAAFDKVDSSTGDSVAGAGLAVYDSEGNLVESWISDGSEHLIRNLVPGTYTLEEESAPKGYKKAESITFDIDYSFVKKTVTMEDDVITGGVHITKTDSVNPDRTLQGVTFMLFKKSDSIMDTSIDRVYQSAWDEPSDDINAFKQDESDLYIGTYVTDENGEISVENLTYGSYYFAETQTLDNYDLLGDKLEFDIDEENVIKEFTVSNTAHEGWIIYGNTVITVPDKSISERTETREPGTPSTTETPSTPVTPDTPHTSVKTGDETAVLWLMVLMTVAFGMIVILVRRRKKTSELLVISGMLILVGAGVCSGGKNILTVSAKETDTVKVGKSVDTGYCDSEPEHDEYIMDTYTDENTGKEYEVKLCFVKSECVESGYSVPVELTGTIGDYNAEYLVYKGKRYDNPGENLYQIEDLIIDFITESGYPQDSYRNLSYEYDGAEYVGTDGVSYRNFKVNFDAYGSRYTFYYKGSLEIPSENTTTDSSKAVDKTPEETTGGNTADNIAVNSVAADIGTSNLDSTPDRHGTVKSGQTTSSEAIKEASGEAPTAGASDDKAGLTVKKSENRIDAATETDTQDVTEEGTGQAAEETTEGDAEEDTKQDKTSVQSSGSDNGNSDGGTGGGGKDELKQDNLVNKIMCAVLVVVIMGAATTYVVIRRRRPSVQ